MEAEHTDEGGGHGLPFECCERLQPGMRPVSPLFLFFDIPILDFQQFSH